MANENEKPPTDGGGWEEQWTEKARKAVEEGGRVEHVAIRLDCRIAEGLALTVERGCEKIGVDATGVLMVALMRSAFTRGVDRQDFMEIMEGVGPRAYELFEKQYMDREVEAAAEAKRKGQVS